MELRRLSDLYWKLSPNLFFVSILLGIFTGVCHSLLIPFIMYAVASDMTVLDQLQVETYSFFNSPTSELATFFVVACATLIVFKTCSSILSTYIAKSASVQHRLSLYDRIQKLSYIEFERIGQPKLINIINLDIPNITNAATTLPVIWGYVVTILGTLSYLIYLDYKVFIFVVLALAVAVVTYQVPLHFATRFFAKSRNHHDIVQAGVRDLVAGAKELKLNQRKAERFHAEELCLPEKKALRETIKGYVLFAFAENYGGIISFLVIGIVVFHLPYSYHISQLELFGIVMALLYLTGPVGFILNTMGIVRQGQVSLAKLQEFYRQLSVEPLGGTAAIGPDWQCLRIEDLTYSYENGSDSFGLKPINLVLKRGDISFIVGGNGSGKSTLGKCISLHYHPSSGRIRFDDQIVNADTLISARQNISAIYSDYHLFKRLYGADCADKARIAEYLHYLDLDGKVSISGDEIDTIALSDGQRRRLALLVLLLEDRSICIFDEWAADQDPRFKEVFYSKILPDLKHRNKLVLVISHDDRYFGYADKLIYMSNGAVDRIVEQDPQRSQSDATEEACELLI